MKKTIFAESEKQGAVRLNFISTQSAEHLKNNQAAHLNSEICPDNKSRRMVLFRDQLTINVALFFQI